MGDDGEGGPVIAMGTVKGGCFWGFWKVWSMWGRGFGVLISLFMARFYYGLFFFFFVIWSLLEI